jgi:hypothetical protein
MIIAKFRNLLSLMIGGATHQNSRAEHPNLSIDTSTDVTPNSGDDVDVAISEYRRALNSLMLSGAERPEEFRAEMELKFLHLVAKGRMEEAKELHAFGILMQTTDYYGRTALHVASENGYDVLKSTEKIILA